VPACAVSREQTLHIQAVFPAVVFTFNASMSRFCLGPLFSGGEFGLALLFTLNRRQPPRFVHRANRLVSVPRRKRRENPAPSGDVLTPANSWCNARIAPAAATLVEDFRASRAKTVCGCGPTRFANTGIGEVSAGPSWRWSGRRRSAANPDIYPAASPPSSRSWNIQAETVCENEKLVSQGVFGLG